MKKEIQIAILIFVGFLAFLWLEKPLREVLASFDIEEVQAKFISGIMVRMVMIGFAILAIQKLKFRDFTGLNSITNFKNIQAIAIPLVFLIMGFIGNWSTYCSTEFLTLFLFAWSVMAVGFLEEFIFRGTIFPLFIKALKNYQRPILMAAILSSSLFGLVHFVNLFRQPENIGGIISQVFFATSIGVFFCGLMVRTENIIIPSLIHALVNFFFGAGELNSTVEEITNIAEENAGINWGSVIPTTILFSFIMAGGIYMIINSDEKSLLSKGVGIES